MNTVALTIRNQIGHRTLFMLGGKNYMAHSDAFSFRIRGCNKVNYIKVTLTSLDLYDIEFGRVWGLNYKVVAEHKGVYADTMHSLIRIETGLATNL